MANNIYPLIAGQVPEHLRDDSPLFVEFLETYYKYASGINKSVSVIQNHASDIDIDTTPDEYVDSFYTAYSDYFPKDVVYDKRNFIKLLDQIYTAKGTEKALKLIFKLLFNDDIKVKYPSEQILLASGGNWTQESFVTSVTKLGTVPILPFYLSISNSFGEFDILVTKVIAINEVTDRFYFKTFEKVVFLDDQVIRINVDGVQVYSGFIIKTPYKIHISVAGTGWQEGQIISFPGTVTPTIARVTKVISNGGIGSIEIVDHGYIHENEQTLTISPYLNKPSGSIVDVTRTLVGIGAYHYTINISDQTDGCDEYVLGLSNTDTFNSYFLENYTSSDYSGTKVIGVLTQQPQSSTNLADTLSLADWIASRAILVMDSAYVVKTKGYFYDDASTLSNQEVKIADNFYYQPFSYVISTTKDIRDYARILELTHPAGTKHFSENNKNLEYSFNFTVERTLSQDTIDVIDGVILSQKNNFDMSKGFSDSVSGSDGIYNTLNKDIEDSVSAISADTTTLTNYSYDELTYFGESYTELSQYLTIG